MTNNKKHLLLITDGWYPQISGVVTTLTNTIKCLEDRGWKVSVIEPRQFKTIKMPGYEWIDLAVDVWKLSKVIKQINPSHVHIAVEGPLGITSKILLDKWGWKYTTAYHTNFDTYVNMQYNISPKLIIKAIKWFHKNSQTILTPSLTTANKLNSWGLTKIKVWGRGVDKQIFFPIDKKSNGYLNLIYVGRVSVEKNIEDFFQLYKEGRKLTVVGDGPKKKEYMLRYPNIEFVGFKKGKELAYYFQNADIFVFPSKTDTLGVVMLEAITCGTPILAYNVEGPKDVVTQNVNGVLVEKNLESAIENILKLDRNKIIESSKNFTWNAATNTFENALVICKK